MSYISQAAITTWHWICWLGVTLFLVCASLLVIPVLVVSLSLDFLPKRRSKPLTSPAQMTRQLPILYREGSDIFAELPDGKVIPLEPLQAKLYALDCFEVIYGAFVWEKTKLPERPSDSKGG